MPLSKYTKRKIFKPNVRTEMQNLIKLNNLISVSIVFAIYLLIHVQYICWDQIND